MEDTLEEFIENLGYPKGTTQEIWEDGVRLGAKWQQKDMIKKLEMHILVNEHDWNRNPQAQFRDFIEQFKK